MSLVRVLALHAPPLKTARVGRATLSTVSTDLSSNLEASIGVQIASGMYGDIHLARAIYRGEAVDAVAKRANQAQDVQDAAEYLNVEADVNARLMSLPNEQRAHFVRFLGTLEEEGEKWLLWDRVRGDGGTATSLVDFCGDIAALEAATGLTPRSVLRQLLLAVDALHSLGFAHRDIKPENVLIEDGRLILIDMGSCAQLDGCPAMEQASLCVGFDPNRSPVTPAFMPPERFVDPLHPWSFDVYSIGLTLLKLCWPTLGPTDEELGAFRAQLRHDISPAPRRAPLRAMIPQLPRRPTTLLCPMADRPCVTPSATRTMTSSSGWWHSCARRLWSPPSSNLSPPSPRTILRALPCSAPC